MNVKSVCLMPQVWYLLGWLNYLQGNDYYGNARYYLKKMQKVSSYW